MDKSRRRPTTRTTRTTFVGTNNNSENINTSRTIDAIDPGDDVSEPSATTMAKKPIRTKEKEKKVKRAPTKERWLLTRKTWKYMADAGRKLIPDGVSNRPEDIPKIEEYFQNVCRNEPKFLHWRRKQSYPGALTSLRRKRRPKVPGSPPKASSADEAEDERDENHHLLVMIRMLEKYLNIKDDVDTEQYSDKDGNSSANAQLSTSEIQKLFSSKASAALVAGMKTSEADYAQRSNTSSSISETRGQSASVAHKQTGFEATKQLSGSNYSLARSNELLKQTWLAQPIDTNNHSVDSVDSSQKKFTSSHQFSENRTSDPTSTYAIPEHSTREPIAHRSMAAMHTSLLLDVLKNYSRTSKNPLLPYDRINTDVLKDKRLLRQIRDELKQQQLERVLKRHTSRSTFNLSNESTTSTPSSSSLSSSNKIFNFWHREPRDDRQSHTSFPNVQLTSFQQSCLKDTGTNSSKKDDRSAVPLISIKSPSHERFFYSSGIQTDPIPITYVHQLYNDYEKKKMEEKREKEESGGEGGKHSRRKSSIDNEDVSQSVSDTIKRYLNMARKKKPKDSDANRFKSVNYDKNLRNIKAKGEITLPGDDDGNMKGCQTDDDWVDHVMRQIKKMERENLSPGSTDDDQTQKQRTHFDYTQEATSAAALKSKSSSTSPNHSSPSSPSPTGLFHSSTQFLSNLLWHSHGNSEKQQQPQQQMFSDYNNFPNTSTAQPHTIAPTKTTMQKSKSSSNVGSGVGQVFSKKIWKSRSKSQTRTASPSESDSSGANIKPNWMPQVSKLLTGYLKFCCVKEIYQFHYVNVNLNTSRVIAFGHRQAVSVFD